MAIESKFERGNGFKVSMNRKGVPLAGLDTAAYFSPNGRPVVERIPEGVTYALKKEIKYPDGRKAALLVLYEGTSNFSNQRNGGPKSDGDIQFIDDAVGPNSRVMVSNPDGRVGLGLKINPEELSPDVLYRVPRKLDFIYLNQSVQ